MKVLGLLDLRFWQRECLLGCNAMQSRRHSEAHNASIFRVRSEKQAAVRAFPGCTVFTLTVDRWRLTSISRSSFLAVAGFTLLNTFSPLTECTSACSIWPWLLDRNEDHPGKRAAFHDQLRNKPVRSECVGVERPISATITRCNNAIKTDRMCSPSVKIRV